MDPCWANQKPSGKPVPGIVIASRRPANRMPAPYETANQIARRTATIRRFRLQ